jgi:hypothetical protein
MLAMHLTDTLKRLPPMSDHHASIRGDTASESEHEAAVTKYFTLDWRKLDGTLTMLQLEVFDGFAASPNSSVERPDEARASAACSG